MQKNWIESSIKILSIIKFQAFTLDISIKTHVSYFNILRFKEKIYHLKESTMLKLKTML